MAGRSHCCLVSVCVLGERENGRLDVHEEENWCIWFGSEFH